MTGSVDEVAYPLTGDPFVDVVRFRGHRPGRVPCYIGAQSGPAARADEGERVIGIARGVTAAVAAALLVLGAGAAGHAQTAAEPAEEPVSGPADIAIPYADTASIEPAPPWRIVDCAAVRGVSELVRSCDAET